MALTQPSHPAATCVCFAVPHEARLFARRIPAHPSITLLLTGIGKTNAQRTIRAALKRSRPTLVVTSGFAGGLNPELKTGSVVFDADPGFPLTERLLSSGGRPATFYCADRIIVSQRDKAELRRLTGADAVDMESAAVRNACSEASIPSATVRVISDAADEDLPLDFNECLSPGCTFDYFRLIPLLLADPRAIPKLIRFQSRLRVANRALYSVLCHTLDV